MQRWKKVRTMDNQSKYYDTQVRELRRLANHLRDEDRGVDAITVDFAASNIADLWAKIQAQRAIIREGFRNAKNT